MATRKNSARSRTPRSRSRAASRAVEESSRRTRKKGAANEVETALSALDAVLRRLNTPAAVIGGIAVISWGFGRATNDIDVAVAASREDVRSLIARFSRGGFTTRIADAEQFAVDNLVMLLRHRETQIDVDVSLAQLAFERVALAGATRRRFGAVSIPVPRVEALIVYKMIAARPHDLRDVEELLALHHRAVDDAYIERSLTEFDALLDLNRTEQWRMIRSRFD